MNTKILTAAGVAATLAQPASAQTPADIARDLLAAVISTSDANMASALLAPNYIEHNPDVASGRDPFVSFIPTLKESGITVETHRIISEGNYVVMHNSYDNAQIFGSKNLVAFDVFRIEGGVVVEHWDNLAPQTPTNPSGHSQSDGPTNITDQHLTAENKKLISNFVTAILIDGNMSQLAGFFDGDNYIQHNSQIGDGLSGLSAALTALAEQGITMKYDRVHRVIAEGNFVFTMSEGHFSGAPTAFFDLFRIQNGKIAEHWDIISKIPTEMAHDNGKF